MADEEDEEPAIELGDGPPVEGAPIARISARFMWGIEKSAIEAREGETTIRTPDGPRELGDILSDVDSTYFATRQEFESAIRDVIGTGPVPVDASAQRESSEAAESEESSESVDSSE
jgi:hypothetical protein